MKMINDPNSVERESSNTPVLNENLKFQWSFQKHVLIQGFEVYLNIQIRARNGDSLELWYLK